MLAILLGCGGATIPRDDLHCEGLDVYVDAPLDLAKAERAVKFWRSVGWALGELHHFDDPRGAPPEGTFFLIEPTLVDKAEEDLDYEVEAIEVTIEWNTGPLCMIAFNDDRSVAKTYVHELGHALGHPNVDVEGHVMAGDPGIQGWATTGLGRSQ